VRKVSKHIQCIYLNCVFRIRTLHFIITTLYDIAMVKCNIDSRYGVQIAGVM